MLVRLSRMDKNRYFPEICGDIRSFAGSRLETGIGSICCFSVDKEYDAWIGFYPVFMAEVFCFPQQQTCLRLAKKKALHPVETKYSSGYKA